MEIVTTPRDHDFQGYIGYPDIATATVPATDGNGYVILGAIPVNKGPSCCSGPSIGWLFKLDETGKIVWETGLNYSSTNLSTLISTSDGGYVATGFYNKNLTSVYPQWDGIVVKFDHGGHAMWIRAGNIATFTTRLLESNDKGILAVGQNTITKLNSNGEKLWVKSYNSTSGSVLTLTGIGNTDDNGLVVTGNSANSGIVMKLDHDGNIQWQEILSDSNHSATANEIQETNDHGFIVVGSIDVASTVQTGPGWYPNHNVSAWMVKMNSNGSIVWQKAYAQNNNWTSGMNVFETNSGYVMSGQSGDKIQSEYGSVRPQRILIMVDKNGNLEWSRMLNVTTANYWSSDLDVAAGNTGFLVVGIRSHGYSHEPWGGPVWIMRLNAQGECCGHDHSFNTHTTTVTTTAAATNTSQIKMNILNTMSGNIVSGTNVAVSATVEKQCTG
jgi:hypothetical protein